MVLFQLPEHVQFVLQILCAARAQFFRANLRNSLTRRFHAATDFYYHDGDPTSYAYGATYSCDLCDAPTGADCVTSEFSNAASTNTHQVCSTFGHNTASNLIKTDMRTFASQTNYNEPILTTRKKVVGGTPFDFLQINGRQAYQCLADESAISPPNCVTVDTPLFDLEDSYGDSTFSCNAGSSDPYPAPTNRMAAISAPSPPHVPLFNEYFGRRSLLFGKRK